MSSPSSFDPADIKGNLTDPQKRTAAKIFQHFIGTPDTSFGAEIGRNLRIVEITVADTRDGGIYPEGWAGDDEGYSWIEDEGAYRSFGSKGKNDEKRMPSKISAKDAIARTVCEIDVTRNMCNVYGTLHGGCAAYMIDPCSVSALVTLGIVAGIDGTGVSQSMVLQWHRPATMGTKLKIVSTTVCLDGHIRTARSELRDRFDNTLYVSATHSTIQTKQPGRPRTNNSAKL